MRVDTTWLAARRWGVFCHYLGAAPSSAGGAELSADAWNRQVDAVDVPIGQDGLVPDAFRRQLAVLRRGW